MSEHHGHHDIGGEPAGPIGRTGHEHALWEKRIDALLMLLSDKKRDLVRVDELRKNIEAIGPDAYDKLSYYERWITSITNTLLERGVFTSDELSRKMAEVETHTREEA